MGKSKKGDKTKKSVNTQYQTQNSKSTNNLQNKSSHNEELSQKNEPNHTKSVKENLDPKTSSSSHELNRENNLQTKQYSNTSHLDPHSSLEEFNKTIEVGRQTVRDFCAHSEILEGFQTWWLSIATVSQRLQCLNRAKSKALCASFDELDQEVDFDQSPTNQKPVQDEHDLLELTPTHLQSLAVPELCDITPLSQKGGEQIVLQLLEALVEGVENKPLEAPFSEDLRKMIDTELESERYIISQLTSDIANEPLLQIAVFDQLQDRYQHRLEFLPYLLSKRLEYLNSQSSGKREGEELREYSDMILNSLPAARTFALTRFMACLFHEFIQSWLGDTIIEEHTQKQKQNQSQQIKAQNKINQLNVNFEIEDDQFFDELINSPNSNLLSVQDQSFFYHEVDNHKSQLFQTSTSSSSPPSSLTSQFRSTQKQIITKTSPQSYSSSPSSSSPSPPLSSSSELQNEHQEYISYYVEQQQQQQQQQQIVSTTAKQQSISNNTNANNGRIKFTNVMNTDQLSQSSSSLPISSSPSPSPSSSPSCSPSQNFVKLPISSFSPSSSPSTSSSSLSSSPSSSPSSSSGSLPSLQTDLNQSRKKNKKKRGPN